MVRGSYCQQVVTFFFFGLQLTARLKLQFQSERPPFKSLDPPLMPYGSRSPLRTPNEKCDLTNELVTNYINLLTVTNPVAFTRFHTHPRGRTGRVSGYSTSYCRSETKLVVKMC